MRIDPETREKIERMIAEGAATEGPPAAVPMPSVELHKDPSMRKVRMRASMRESEFQLQVIEYAQVRKWRVAHFRAVRVQRANGETYYETPVAANGKGFFDLLLVRERLIVIELKIKPNGPTEDQLRWLEWYTKAGVEAHVFYPEQWAEIKTVLA